MIESELEYLISNLHDQYLDNENHNNKKNILIAYQSLLESTVDINWNDYNPELYEKFNTLISCIKFHIDRWR